MIFFSCMSPLDFVLNIYILRHSSQQKFLYYLFFLNIRTIKRHLQRFKFIVSWYFSPLLPFTSLFPIELCKECVLAIFFFFSTGSLLNVFLPFIFIEFFIPSLTLCTLQITLPCWSAVLIYQVINGTTRKLNNLLLSLKEPVFSGPGGIMEDPSVCQTQARRSSRLKIPDTVLFANRLL